jgi:diaminopimelate decarboxylase
LGKGNGLLDRLALFPLASGVNDEGHLVIGGCDTARLTSEFGTPLYVFDEFTVRSRCREIKEVFAQSYAGARVIYAGKAFINKALALILMEEGLGLDAVSAGEMGIARSVGFPGERVYFHGNNKSADELRLALDWPVGRIVVDNFNELTLLAVIAGEKGVRPDILLRLSPAVDPHTHQYIATGVLDSKFGFPMASAEEAVRQAMAVTSLNLAGLHFHIGSLIPGAEPYEAAVAVVLDFAAEMKRKFGFELGELNIGGGIAVQYTLDSLAPPVAAYARAIASKITRKCHELGLSLPQLVVEPGRAIVGQAGVALYTAGAIKDIPGVRRYVSVDGGMGDNIRTALYGSRYEAVIANKMREEASARATIAGRFCESGDILVKDIELPAVAAGDIVAIPVSGAYCLPLASNYNASFRPAVVMVKEGEARLVRRRETLEDLTRCDLV